MMWKPIQLNTDKTLYLAIADEIERAIARGELKPGEKMPPQRALARIIGVNLTTITRAYREAEKRGLITGVLGSGTYVASIDGRNTDLPQSPPKNSTQIDMALVGSLKCEDVNIAQILKSVADDEALEMLLDYTPSQGLESHRVTAAHWVSRFGIKTTANSMVICAGAMHAINCCLLGLFEPGDRIAVDALTFAGFKAAAQMARIKLEPIPMDDQGMLPEYLDSICKRGGIKGIYLMPNMQNPTVTALSYERKQKLAQIIRKHGLILIEDDIYSFTNLENPPSLTAMVPEQGIYISGFSKFLYAGLRIAFVAVPERFKHAFIQAVVNTIWTAPPFNAEIICRLIKSGEADKIIARKQTVIAHRMAIAREALDGYKFKSSDNAMFLWLMLPKGWNCADFENAARSNGVGVLSAYKFHVGNTLPPNAVRISIASVKDEDELREGLGVIVNLLKNEGLRYDPVM